MQIKEVKPLTFFYHSVRTTMSGLSPLVGVVARELYREAAALDLAVTGPIYWQYIGLDPKPEAEFTLHIALPVDEERADYTGKFAFQRTEPFRCLTAVHEGDWAELPRTYRQLFGSLAEQNLRPTGLSREVFLNMDFAEPAANVTEVQIGIQ
jgi:effector-binding domain-containing protein